MSEVRIIAVRLIRFGATTLWSRPHPTGASEHDSIYCPGSINNASQALRAKRRWGGPGYKYETYELYWQGLAKLAPVISRGAPEWNNRQVSFITAVLRRTSREPPVRSNHAKVEICPDDLPSCQAVHSFASLVVFFLFFYFWQGDWWNSCFSIMTIADGRSNKMHGFSGQVSPMRLL